MMGERTGMQEALFYEFSLEQHIPERHMLRLIDRLVDLTPVRKHLQPFYSDTGRPSIDPELLIRMLIIGYCMGIRSERCLCEEVHLNLAYRWFCRLGLDGAVPDHSTFSKNRHGRFRESDLLRQVFETTVRRCIDEKLVGGENFGVDASLIRADVDRQRAVPGEEGLPFDATGHAVREYLETLDDAAFGGSTPVVPKKLAPTDPAARFTAATPERAFFAYSTNYLIDLDHAVIMDVEATTAVRQAQVTAQRRMMSGCRTGLTSGRHVSRPIPLMAMRRTWPGWSTSAASNRIFRCSTNPPAPMGRSPGPTSGLTTRTTGIFVRSTRNCVRRSVTLRHRVNRSIRTGLSATAPASTIPTSVNSDRAARRIRLLARSCARSTRVLEIWPAISR